MEKRKHIKLFEDVQKVKNDSDTKGEPSKVKDFNEFSVSTNKDKDKKKKAKESEEHEEHVRNQEILKNSGGNA